jgi:signal transduction histidine kinase
MHDIQSLIDSNASTNKETLQRINYQKKVNKDLLFFIRDFDIFKSEIPLKNFIRDSLHLIDLKAESIKIDMQDENLILKIDVELFSETFNVVVKNALRAVENDLSKIEINIYSQPSESPFLKLSWLIFEVIDYGNGIAEEFEPFITKPFFTTHKHDGHTGFGLSNAQKILNAHKGFWEISTGKATKVKIYLPRENDE